MFVFSYGGSSHLPMIGGKSDHSAYSKVGTASRMSNRSLSRLGGIDGFSQSSHYSSARKLASASYASLPRSVHIYCEPTSSRISDMIEEISVDRRKILLQEKLVEGSFSQVYKGIYIKDANSEVNLMVKTISDKASDVETSLFLAEGMSMFRINHRNIQAVFAACIEDPSKPLLLYPLHYPGNLKYFLRNCKSSIEVGQCVQTLSTQTLVSMAIQIAQAMVYLHKKNRLHTDLATRNCVAQVLDDGNYLIKITDSALSRDLFPADYHTLSDNESRPVKWLSIESLVRNEFTQMSDVWSFGVTLWELMTLGKSSRQFDWRG